MIDIKDAMSELTVAAGLNAVKESGIAPLSDPKEILLAICRLVHANSPVPPWLAMDVFQLVRTLMEHGLTGWQSPSSEDPV